MIKITELISDEMCYQAIRKIRWENGEVCCPKCKSVHTKKNGHDDVHTARQQYQCKACRCFFDDLTDTVFSGHHQPLKVWVACLYLMGLNARCVRIVVLLTD